MSTNLQVFLISFALILTVLYCLFFCDLTCTTTTQQYCKHVSALNTLNLVNYLGKFWRLVGILNSGFLLGSTILVYLSSYFRREFVSSDQFESECISVKNSESFNYHS